MECASYGTERCCCFCMHFGCSRQCIHQQNQSLFASISQQRTNAYKNWMNWFYNNSSFFSRNLSIKLATMATRLEWLVVVLAAVRKTGEPSDKPSRQLVAKWTAIAERRLRSAETANSIRQTNACWIDQHTCVNQTLQIGDSLQQYHKARAARNGGESSCTSGSNVDMTNSLQNTQSRKARKPHLHKLGIKLQRRIVLSCFGTHFARKSANDHFGRFACFPTNIFGTLTPLQAGNQQESARLLFFFFLPLRRWPTMLPALVRQSVRTCYQSFANSTTAHSIETNRLHLLKRVKQLKVCSATGNKFVGIFQPRIRFIFRNHCVANLQV